MRIITEIVEEVFYGNMIQIFEIFKGMDNQGDQIVPVELVKVYQILAGMGPDALLKEYAMIYTKYKTKDKNVKPIV
jgi:hypothetical protein